MTIHYDLWQGLTNAGIVLERMHREEDALSTYAYAVHSYRDQPTESAKVRQFYANQLQKVGKAFYDMQEYVSPLCDVALLFLVESLSAMLFLLLTCGSYKSAVTFTEIALEYEPAATRHRTLMNLATIQVIAVRCLRRRSRRGRSTCSCTTTPTIM